MKEHPRDLTLDRPKNDIPKVKNEGPGDIRCYFKANPILRSTNVVYRKNLPKRGNGGNWMVFIKLRDFR